MIYVYPVGGLGNILFHIASIWTLAQDNNSELCLLNIEKKLKELDSATNVTDTWHRAKHSENYRFILDRFPHTEISIQNTSHCAVKYTPLRFEDEFEYRGYFQDERYFLHRRKEILQLFRPSSEIKNAVDKYSDIFGNISLHVRRSWKTLRLEEYHPVQPTAYYLSALEKLPEDLKVLIFSDDIEWCKQEFIGDRFVYAEEEDYISLYLMSKMKYHIIANSTFSWWGAWLSDYDGKVVIAPENWFGPKNELYAAKTIVPESWIKL